MFTDSAENSFETRNQNTSMSEINTTSTLSQNNDTNKTLSLKFEPPLSPNTVVLNSSVVLGENRVGKRVLKSVEFIPKETTLNTFQGSCSFHETSTDIVQDWSDDFEVNNLKNIIKLHQINELIFESIKKLCNESSLKKTVTKKIYLKDNRFG